MGVVGCVEDCSGTTRSLPDAGRTSPRPRHSSPDHEAERKKMKKDEQSGADQPATEKDAHSSAGDRGGRERLPDRRHVQDLEEGESSGSKGGKQQEEGTPERNGKTGEKDLAPEDDDATKYTNNSEQDGDIVERPLSPVAVCAGVRGANEETGPNIRCTLEIDFVQRPLIFDLKTEADLCRCREESNVLVCYRSACRIKAAKCASAPLGKHRNQVRAHSASQCSKSAVRRTQVDVRRHQKSDLITGHTFHNQLDEAVSAERNRTTAPAEEPSSLSATGKACPNKPSPESTETSATMEQHGELWQQDITLSRSESHQRGVERNECKESKKLCEGKSSLKPAQITAKRDSSADSVTTDKESGCGVTLLTAGNTTTNNEHVMARSRVTTGNERASVPVSSVETDRDAITRSRPLGCRSPPLLNTDAQFVPLCDTDPRDLALSNSRQTCPKSDSETVSLKAGERTANPAHDDKHSENPSGQQRFSFGDKESVDLVHETNDSLPDQCPANNLDNSDGLAALKTADVFPSENGNEVVQWDASWADEKHVSASDSRDCNYSSLGPWTETEIEALATVDSTPAETTKKENQTGGCESESKNDESAFSRKLDHKTLDNSLPPASAQKAELELVQRGTAACPVIGICVNDDESATTAAAKALLSASALACDRLDEYTERAQTAQTRDVSHAQCETLQSPSEYFTPITTGKEFTQEGNKTENPTSDPEGVIMLEHHQDDQRPENLEAGNLPDGAADTKSKTRTEIGLVLDPATSYIGDNSGDSVTTVCPENGQSCPTTPDGTSVHDITVSSANSVTPDSLSSPSATDVTRPGGDATVPPASTSDVAQADDVSKDISAQLAALLREKENMLEEFRKRALELERTVQNLRVELNIKGNRTDGQ